jgi:hypothetical protein
MSKIYGDKDENWSVLNFLNAILELETSCLQKIKHRKNLKTHKALVDPNCPSREDFSTKNRCV